MALFDFSMDKLTTYDPAEKAPRDFEAFWKRTLAETEKAGPAAPHFVEVKDSFYKLVDVYDVTFKGYGGQDVKGWFIEPTGNEKALPCVVTFVGYGGGRSLPVDHFSVAVAGFANLVMDTRGQGSNWSPGATADIGEREEGGQYPGFMTRGILSPETYYYRRVFMDAVRAVEAAGEHPHVDASRIAVMGGSQGGGIAIAAAAILGKRVKVAMADVPFLCHFTRATTLVDSSPYVEIANYLRAHRDRKEAVYNTLSYFDGIHFASKITARVLFSVGLMDQTCPPSTVYAAYNRIKGKKEMRIYDFNNHEGGGPFQHAERLRFAAAWL
ncbi:MAG: acetylxylan esterase [Phycisphaerales bacterium]|nr:acetylxylan esterase [Phycisphaerales bacterium]